MDREIRTVFENTNSFFAEIEGSKTNDPSLNDLIDDLATQGVIDLLSQAAQVARYVPKVDVKLRENFRDSSQRLVDFLEKTGSVETLKEVSSMREIHEYVKLRIPEYYSKHIS